MVGINVGIPVPVSFFPFAGHKDSFFGESHVFGLDGIRFFTETKCVTIALVHRGREEGEEGRHLGGHCQQAVVSAGARRPRPEQRRTDREGRGGRRLRPFLLPGRLAGAGRARRCTRGVARRYTKQTGG